MSKVQTLRGCKGSWVQRQTTLGEEEEEEEEALKDRSGQGCRCVLQARVARG